MSVCLFVRSRISPTTRPNVTKLSVRVTSGMMWPWLLPPTTTMPYDLVVLYNGSKLRTEGEV